MIKVKVPQLLEERGMNATDLSRKCEIAYVTALRLSRGEANAMYFDVLTRLCKFFGVGVDAILEYFPDEQ